MQAVFCLRDVLDANSGGIKELCRKPVAVLRRSRGKRHRRDFFPLVVGRLLDDPLFVNQLQEVRKGFPASRPAVPNRNDLTEEFRLEFGDGDVLRSGDRVDVRGFPRPRTKLISRPAVRGPAMLSHLAQDRQ